MRITFVIASADLAGGCKVVAIYAKKLQERGHEVLVVAPAPYQPSVLEGTRHLQRSGDPQMLINAVRRPVPPHHLALQGAPHKLLERDRPVEPDDVPDADVIVATWWETAEWIRDFPPSKGAKAYFIQHHEVNMPGQPNNRVDATWRLPYHKITISHWLVEKADELAGDRDVSLVFNSVDMDQFHAPARDKGEPPTVGVLYATAGFKGLDISLPAIERAREEIPDLQVVAFGAEPPISRLPLPEGTHYTQKPPQDQIRDVYAKCDVWLCGSRAEGFHLPPLEAMACRCPVVSTRVGGPMDIVKDGVNGWVVPVEDSVALSERLLDVLRLDPAAWKAMSDAAYKVAVDYTWDDATELFYQGLEKAVAKGQQRTTPPRRTPTRPTRQALGQLAMIAGNFGDGPLIEESLDDWRQFFGGPPAMGVMVDNGADQETQRVLFGLAKKGSLDRVGLVHPKSHDLGAHQCYIAEHLAGSLATTDYLFWFHVDTLPYRRGFVDWLDEAYQFLERDDVFAFGGSFNVASKSMEAWPGFYFSDKCSENFALMKRATFIDAVEHTAGDFVRAGYHAEHPKQKPAMRARYLLEVAFEEAILRQRRYTLCRGESMDWTVFHSNCHGGELRAARDRYYRREGIQEFLDVGNAYPVGDEYMNARNYGKPSPHSVLKRLRIAFGDSALGPMYRKITRGEAEIEDIDPEIPPLVFEMREASSANPLERTSVVLILGDEGPSLTERLARVEGSLSGSARQTIAYIDPTSARADDALKLYFDGRLDKLLLIRGLSTGAFDAGWVADQALLAAAIEPYVIVAEANSAHPEPEAAKGALELVDGGAPVAPIGDGVRAFRRDALVRWTETVFGRYATSGVVGPGDGQRSQRPDTLEA